MSREYPAGPVVGVGVVVLGLDGRVLLARRRNPPSEGLWSVPGGMLELGETLDACAVREVREECGVRCAPLAARHVSDYILRDDAGRVRYHYVLVDVLARWVEGTPRAGDDALEVGWFPADEIGALPTTEGLREVVADLLVRGG